MVFPEPVAATTIRIWWVSSAYKIESRAEWIGSEDECEEGDEVTSSDEDSDDRSSELPGRAEPGFQKTGFGAVADMREETRLRKVTPDSLPHVAVSCMAADKE